MRKAILGILFLILYFGVSAAIYFASAGRTDLPLAWAYFGSKDWQQHHDGSDAGCGGARCWPVPLERTGRPRVADCRAGVRVSGICVHGVGYAGQPILFFSGAIAVGPRSSRGRLRTLPIRASSRLPGSCPVSCVRWPGTRLVACHGDCRRAHDCDSAAPDSS